MSSALLEKILELSSAADRRFLGISNGELESFSLHIPVPFAHGRHQNIQTYTYAVGDIESIVFDTRTLVLADQAFESSPWVAKSIQEANTYWLIPMEEQTKERGWLDDFIARRELNAAGISSVVAIGGGVMLNASAYIAEKLHCELIYVPTTVLAMSDVAIGGKVRANSVTEELHLKHTYKSFYEPNGVILDVRFLNTLPPEQISIGMGEIIKHGVYQSKPLLDFISSTEFNPFERKGDLLKAILWTIALKSICLEVDPEETADGSHVILRGAHELSDEIEEKSQFTIPHGTAVAMAIHTELSRAGSDHLSQVETCFNRLRISIPEKT